MFEMNDTCKVRQNHTAPCVRCYAKDELDSIDLTGATAVFNMWTLQNGQVITNGTCTVDATNKCVEYHWSASDTATPGEYKGLFTITLASGEILGAPADGRVKVVITPYPPE